MTRRVLVVGAGAAGTLTALHLVGRRVPVDVTLVDPAPRRGRGTAFGTVDGNHLLNVPAFSMSALTDDPGHFVRWLGCSPPEFAPRSEYGRYLDDTLGAAVRGAGGVASMRHLRRSAVAVDLRDGAVQLVLDDGSALVGDALVVATGLPGAGVSWVPRGLAGSPRFVADPWATGALERVRADRAGLPDVLLVGTGLTMTDLALTLSDGRNPGSRRLHAVSRRGLLPEAHLDGRCRAVVPEVGDWGPSLRDLRRHVAEHVAAVVERTGDWRPAIDGLRHRMPELWGRLSESDRLRFLAEDAPDWNRRRHRMPPSTAVLLRELRACGRLTVCAGEVSAVEPISRGLRVTLSNGRVHDVGWVVNCTSPETDVRRLGNPLIDDLLRDRPGGPLAPAAPGGMGFRTNEGRVGSAPVWVLGALRRGELWESTAIPEIRDQAQALARTLLGPVAARTGMSSQPS